MLRSELDKSRESEQECKKTKLRKRFNKLVDEHNKLIDSHEIDTKKVERQMKKGEII